MSSSACASPKPSAAPSRRRPRRSEEHTSELQSPCNLVCRLLLEKKKNNSASFIIFKALPYPATLFHFISWRTGHDSNHYSVPSSTLTTTNSSSHTSHLLCSHYI